MRFGKTETPGFESRTRKTMNTTLRTVAAAVLFSAVLITGCVVSVGNRGYSKLDSGTRRVVTKAQFDQVVEANKSVYLGMDQHDVLATYPADLLTKFETGSYDGRDLEVWQVRAVSRSGGNSFQRWLYFVDGSLVEMARSEVDYRDEPDTLERWLRN